MISPDIPATLQGRGRESSISTERALKQVLKLLDMVEPTDAQTEDMLNASMDDVEMMIKHVT